MCGIVGYVGKDEAGPILLHGLQRLEYRGYDSTGIAVRLNNEFPIVVKAEGKLQNLINKTNDGKAIHANYGIRSLDCLNQEKLNNDIVSKTLF